MTDFYSDERLLPQSCTVWEQEPHSVSTGLVTQEGKPLYRNYQINPIGFIYLKEGDA